MAFMKMPSAEAMAADIKAAFETGMLTEAETSQLKGVLTEIIGDARLAEVYVGQVLAVGNINGYMNRLNIHKSKVVEKASLDNPFDDDGSLKPDVTYSSGEFGYNYETDSLSRITNFNTDELQITGRDKRLRHNRNTPGKLPGDHAAHLAGDLFGGSPDLDNLVSQLSDVNLSQYRKVENIWAKAIREGKKVSVNVEIGYEGNSIRPSEFIVQYEIDGIFFERTINNN